MVHTFVWLQKMEYYGKNTEPDKQTLRYKKLHANILFVATVCRYIQYATYAAVRLKIRSEDFVRDVYNLYVYSWTRLPPCNVFRIFLEHRMNFWNTYVVGIALTCSLLGQSCMTFRFDWNFVAPRTRRRFQCHLKTVCDANVTSLASGSNQAIVPTCYYWAWKKLKFINLLILRDYNSIIAFLCDRAASHDCAYSFVLDETMFMQVIRFYRSPTFLKYVA